MISEKKGWPSQEFGHEKEFSDDMKCEIADCRLQIEKNPNLKSQISNLK
jgi:hypothetical protein